MPFPNPSTQYTPGHNRPGPGRPRKRIITDEAVDYLAELHPKHEGKTRARVIAEKMVDAAEDDLEAREKLLDRVEGKPTQSIEASVTTHDDSGTDRELDGWAEQRVKAKDREAQSGGSGGAGVEGGVAMGAAPRAPEPQGPGPEGAADQAAVDHDAPAPRQE